MSVAREDGRGREARIMLAVAGVLAVLPFIMPHIGGYRELATRIVIWSIFALGFDLLVGFTGLLSFGHAAFWGTGAYVAGYYLLHASSEVIPALVIGTAVVALISVLLGYLTLRRTGIYFAILTLAFAEMFYYAALSPLQQWTGGENGLTGLPRATLGGLRLEGLTIYYFVAAIAFVAVYVARRIKRSPYGLLLRAIQSNELRLESTGFHVRRYKLMAFVVSGIYAGLAGSLYAAYETYVPTESLHWVTSGQVVMMAVIGGLGTLFGPMFGAALVLYLENVLSAWTQQWLLLQGLIFMAVIIFFPGGVAEGVRRMRARLRSREPEPTPAPQAGAEKQPRPGSPGQEPPGDARAGRGEHATTEAPRRGTGTRS
jgi:branched-chain amino acid transport system permease protein